MKAEELSDVAENREVFRVFLRLLPRDTLGRVAGVKMNERKNQNEIFDNIFFTW